MNLIRIREPNALRPLDVVLIFAVTMTVAGGFLMLSAAESLTLVDGAVEWQTESPLRAVVQLLCLNYRFPTINAGDVKGYILGIGAGLAVLAIAIAVLTKAKDVDDESGDASGSAPESAPVPARVDAVARNQVSPLTAAQLLVGMFLLWSFASSRWSGAPDIAIGGSILLAIQYLWALAIGNGLRPRAARIAVQVVLIVTLTTSIVALWYYYGRNPMLRAKFPFGNPTFLSACLIPGIIWSVTAALQGVGDFLRTRAVRPLLLSASTIVVLVPAAWAFKLADSRASQVGLGVAVLSVAFFAFHGRWKVAPVVLAIVLAIVTWRAYIGQAENSRSGRGESLRLRGYAWNYAMRMMQQRPITGYGQGGFALFGDTFAVDDVLDDPPVFESRIDHAHNEWLETMADLGTVGIVLLCAAIALTFWGGALALRGEMPSGERWALSGALAGLVALMVDECAGVGLRVSEVPVTFYTVLGLTWALATPASSRFVPWASQASWRRGVIGYAGLTMAFAVLLMTQLDFDAARSAYQTDEHIVRGEFDAAIVAAERGRPRLSPQRELVSRSRLAETHIFVAERVFDRALDRDRRGRSSELPDQRLLALAQADMTDVEDHAKSAGHVLKELVARAPGFINSGWLEYRIHLLRARSAAMRGDTERALASQKSAAAALERELLRQPFNADLTIAYVRAAAGESPLEMLVMVLARPLRYGRIVDAHLDILQRLNGLQGFDSMFGPLVDEALKAITGSTPTDETGKPRDIWAPERLRLAATIRFLRGSYSDAANLLRTAATAYDALAAKAPLGAASCHAELGEALFFSDPNSPQPAIDEAKRAISIAPESRLGREFRSVVRQRLVYYQLAAGDEAEARRLLRESAPARVAEEVVEHEIGIRLRRLCESMLLQRREALILRKPADDLIPKLQRWLARAIEINPDDYTAHFLAADLAMHVGDDVTAAEHLRVALKSGLHPDDARQFLGMARERKPESAVLRALWNELGGDANAKDDSAAPQTHTPEKNPAPSVNPQPPS
jgi:O-antigen ligase/tetratricopeptide (TPR) repeat protein